MPISIQCPHCSGTLKVRDESAAGKKVRCPKCEEPFVVEFPVEDDYTQDSFANTDFGDTGEEDTEEVPVRRRSAREEAPKKKKGKKKKSGNSMAWVLPVAIGFVVLALVGGLGTVAVMFGPQLLAFGGDGNKIDMTYLPPDAAGVMHVRLADVWNSPLGQQFANMPQVQQQMASLGTNEIKPPDITGVTLSIPNNVQGMQVDPEVIVVMRCKKRVDMTRSSPGTRVDTLTHNGTKYYKMTSPGSEMCAWQPSGAIVVMGSDAHIRRAIERGSKKTRRPEFDFIDASPQVVLAALNNSGGTAALGSMPGMGDIEQKFKQSVKGVCVGLTVREGIDVKAALECNPGGASDIKAAIDKALQDGKQGIAEAKRSPFAMFGPAKEMFDVAEQTMATLQVSQTGDQVAVTGSVPGSIKPLLEKLAAQSGGMGPGGMPPGPGPMPGSHGQPMPMPGGHGQPMPMPMPGPPGAHGGPPPGHGQPPR